VEIVGYPILPDAHVMSVATLPRWARAALVVRGREILEPAAAGKLRPGDYAYFLAPALRVPRLDGLFAARAERGRDIGTEWQFSLHGDAPLAELNTLYDLNLPPGLLKMTVTQLFAERFETAPNIGDSLPLGPCVVTVTALDEDDVAEAVLHFDEESIRPTLIGRLRTGLRNLIDSVIRR
jgi:cell volume regulation protein A